MNCGVFITTVLKRFKNSANEVFLWDTEMDPESLSAVNIFLRDNIPRGSWINVSVVCSQTKANSTVQILHSIGVFIQRFCRLSRARHISSPNTTGLTQPLYSRAVCVTSDLSHLLPVLLDYRGSKRSDWLGVTLLFDSLRPWDSVESRPQSIMLQGQAGGKNQHESHFTCYVT